jgi:DNA-binding transcriptional MerR regulator
LSIDALSRATRIPVETLRTWEARYGFPAPARKASGHRLYPASIVPRLLRVAEALSLGLDMAALVLAAAGWRVVHLDPEAPLEQLTQVARERHARLRRGRRGAWGPYYRIAAAPGAP